MNRVALRLLSLSLLALGVIGCASGPKFTESMQKAQALTPDKGRIFFYREGSPVGAAIQPEIKLNDKVIGNSKPGNFFYIDLPGGNYIVTCSTEAEHKLSFSLDAGETKYVRTTITMGMWVGQVWPALEDKATAMKMLPDLSLDDKSATPGMEKWFIRQ